MKEKLKLRGPSVFIGKQGNGIISFGSGQPDLPPPKEAVENIEIRNDLRYGLIQGELALRQALTLEYSCSKPENFVITNGASEALDLVFRALKPGKVLLAKPYYYSYPYYLEFAGQTPVYTELVDGRIDLDDFKKKVVDCQAVLINSPSNPTGGVESIETLKEIERITSELGICLISDEVYKELIYDREHYLMQGDHVVTINSFSKTYAMCGVRVGYLWSNNQVLVDRVVDIKSHTSMNTNLVGQDMALKAMSAPKSYVENQLKIWHERRNLMYLGLKDIGLDLSKPEGAFYVLPKVERADEFITRLYHKYKVIAYLGDWFGAKNRIRLSYALDKAEIKEGLEKIKACLEDY